MVDLLADGHLDHAGRADVHRRLALDHDHDVGERGQVGRAGGRRSEEDADLGNDARELHLVVEDAAGVVAAGEDADLLGDAGARRVDEVDERDLEARRLLLDADDLLDRLLAPGAGLHREVVGHDADRPAQDRAHAGDDAVGGHLGLGGAGEEPVLLELGAGIEEEAEAVADEELALRPELVAVLDVPLPDARDLVAEAPLAHARHGSTGVGRGPARAGRYSSRERIAMIRTPVWCGRPPISAGRRGGTSITVASSPTGPRLMRTRIRTIGRLHAERLDLHLAPAGEREALHHADGHPRLEGAHGLVVRVLEHLPEPRHPELEPDRLAAPALELRRRGAVPGGGAGFARSGVGASPAWGALPAGRRRPRRPARPRDPRGRIRRVHHERVDADLLGGRSTRSRRGRRKDPRRRQRGQLGAGGPGRDEKPHERGQDEREAGAEHLAKTLPRVVQAGHHGPHGNAEHLRDLAVLEPFNVAEDDNGSVVL